MIPSQNIDLNLSSVQLTDSFNQVLDMMDEFKVYHLPVVDGKEYLGYVSEEILLNANGDLIGDLVLAGEKVFTSDAESLYSSIKKMATHQMSTIAVLDIDNQYIGTISTYSVFKTLSEIAAVRSNGGVFSIVVNQQDYSLAEISRILESNGYKIMSVELVTVPETPTMVEVIIKVSSYELTSAIATMERYGYIVKLRFGKNAYDQDDKERISEILNFLNL